MSEPTDIRGERITDTEQAILDVYTRLKTLAGRPDLPPCVASNVRFALATTWQMVNDLGLEFEQLDHVGV